MNREILFEAKIVDNSEWVYGDLIKTNEGYCISVNAELGTYDNTDLYSTEWYKIIPETVCQYTNLDDKNGKKIFDKARLKRMIYTGKIEYEYYTVKWINDLGLWGLIIDGQEDYYIGQELYKIANECEVIDSIHDKT